MVNARPSDRSVIGFLLVGLGVMFLLDTTNALGPDANIVGTYWPALLIAWGLWGFIGSGFVLRLWFFLVLVVGIVFLLSTLDVWDWDFGQLWPVLLVLIGLVLLFGNRLAGRRRRRGWWGRMPQRPTVPPVIDSGRAYPEGGPAGGFRASSVFSGSRERITAQDFPGGEVSAIFGGVELDLRDAGLAGGKAVIDANVMCGGVELRVPRDWRVNFQTTTLLGGVEDKRSQPAGVEVKGELTITGSVLCGGIEVKD